MTEHFYMDYGGSYQAARRFELKAEDLDAAAADGAEASVTGMQGPMGATAPVQSAADDVLLALGGRLRVFSAEMFALSKLVDDTVEITNEIDVEYQI